MSTKTRKKREKEARRQDILEAAKAVFFQKGFQAATMEQIAEASELSKGTLYLYFPSKEELYITLLLEGLEILRGMMSAAIRDAGDWASQLRSVGMAYYEFFQRYKHYFRILFFLQHNDLSSQVSESLYHMCIEKGRSCLEILVQIIQEGMERGEIDRQDPMEVAVVLWGFLNGIILVYEDEASHHFLSSPLDAWIALGIKLALEGVRKR